MHVEACVGREEHFVEGVRGLVGGEPGEGVVGVGRPGGGGDVVEAPAGGPGEGAQGGGEARVRFHVDHDGREAQGVGGGRRRETVDDPLQGLGLADACGPDDHAVGMQRGGVDAHGPCPRRVHADGDGEPVDARRGRSAGDAAPLPGLGPLDSTAGRGFAGPPGPVAPTVARGLAPCGVEPVPIEEVDPGGEGGGACRERRLRVGPGLPVVAEDGGGVARVGEGVEEAGREVAVGLEVGGGLVGPYSPCGGRDPGGEDPGGAHPCARGPPDDDEGDGDGGRDGVDEDEGGEDDPACALPVGEGAGPGEPEAGRAHDAASWPWGPVMSASGRTRMGRPSPRAVKEALASAAASVTRSCVSGTVRYTPMR